MLVDVHGTPLRESLGYSGGGVGFGGQMADWVPPAESVDAALLPSLRLGNARADDLVRQARHRDGHRVGGAVVLRVEPLEDDVPRLAGADVDGELLHRQVVTGGVPQRAAVPADLDPASLAKR